MKYTFNLKLTTPKGHEILIDTAACYGYWMTPDGEADGHLQFFRDPAAAEDNPAELTDYDGVYKLPLQVYEALAACDKLIVDEVFNPNYEF